MTGKYTDEQLVRLAEIRKSRETGKDNYGKPRREFYDELRGMDDAELFSQTKKTMWLSAYANNNPKSDYHWQADACLDIWDDRDKVEEYTRALHEVRGETCG